jgi:hypothetical protein
MLFVADCRQVSRIGMPITGDQPTAMENGPVLSHILNLFNGEKKSAYWSAHFSTADHHYHVRVIDDPGTDLLSDSEKKSLSVAFDRLKIYPWPALVHHLHQRTEWIKHQKGRSSAPIPFESILEAEGRSDDFVETLKDQEAESALLDKLFA